MVVRSGISHHTDITQTSHGHAHDLADARTDSHTHTHTEREVHSPEDTSAVPGCCTRRDISAAPSDSIAILTPNPIHTHTHTDRQQPPLCAYVSCVRCLLPSIPQAHQPTHLGREIDSLPDEAFRAHACVSPLGEEAVGRGTSFMGICRNSHKSGHEAHAGSCTTCRHAPTHIHRQTDRQTDRRHSMCVKRERATGRGGGVLKTWLSQSVRSAFRFS